MDKAVTLAFGDGIGPEIMNAVLKIMQEAQVKLSFETIDIGEKLYKKGITSGMADDAWINIRRTKNILKAPITTPQGGGYKSLNVTMRKTLGLYANIRPTKTYVPYVPSKFNNIDLVVVRENEEDLYAGIEYQQTHDMYQSLKLISETGSEKIIRFAFEYALKNNRKKVSCFSKDNIMKMSDGIFHKTFDRVAKEYPQINTDHYIVDIGTARVAAKPEIFDVIVTSNLYGDIISDVASEVAGSVGLAGSSNIGNEYAMFEAIHGSAPDIAGQNIANPSGLLNGAIMMLVHLGLAKEAGIIHNAWLKTLENGIHTADIYNAEYSTKKAKTDEFAEHVIGNLGEKPKKFAEIIYPDVFNETQEESKSQKVICVINKKQKKKLVGIDIFIDWCGDNHEELAEYIQEHIKECKLQLQGISCKGLAIWPKTIQLIDYLSDHWRLRFVPLGEKICDYQDVIKLQQALIKAEFEIIKTENLYLFDDKLGFSLNQGE